MKIYHTLHIGTAHTNHCEDYLMYCEIGANTWLFAVLDGCTMGHESYFASALAGKVLKKSARELAFLWWKNEYTTDLNTVLKQLLERFFGNFKSIKNQMLLEQHEILSTVQLFLYDTQNQRGKIIVLGDGVVCVDGVITEFEQDNKPDYFGYHLDEDFEPWFESQGQRMSIKHAKDVSLATDGIMSFEQFDLRDESQDFDAAHFLLLDPYFIKSEQMLFQKMLLLEKEHGLKPLDDLAVIRVIL